MSTMTIPGAVVPYIRAGAQLQMAGAAEELSGSIGEAMESGLAPLGERRRLLQAWALVDLLGWPVERSGPVELEVHGHREGLLGALQGNADRLARLIADEPDDPQRASRRDDLQALLEFEAALRAVERDQPTTVTAADAGRCGRVAAWRAVRRPRTRVRGHAVNGAKDSRQLGGRSATHRAGTSRT